MLLLDKDTFPSDMPMSTHLIHQRGVARLARWGLREQAAATGCAPVTRGRFDFGPVTLTTAPPAVEGEAAAFAPRRLLLDDILVRAAVEGGVEPREGCRVNDLVAGDEGVQGVRAESQGGTPFEEQGRIVIGADGPSSRVAARVGARAYSVKPALQGTAWTYWKGDLLDEFVLHLGEYEAVYAFPSSGGTTLVGANWAIDRFHEIRRTLEASHLDVIRRLAPDLFHRLAEAERAEDRVYVGATRNFFREASGPGWALVGDAHYKKDPCTAQGITDAFCDADLLAEAVDDGLRGNRDLLEALKERERATVAQAMPFYELTCQLARFEPPTAEQAALYAALQDDPENAEAFIGTITTAVSPADFFAPANLERIMERAGSGR